ncbi:hypothetical protein Bsph_4186 [Lysinibacillus sphaericus C3-41]|uniref:Uncharacterized protein n=1 Tax=Lysinibacillus sphaericus (strain C3-41) TaxID=444177 RepID=B1HX71_LYSSC|nr:hypothetical protein Bsph_4186 [Lysinibacillus sphaericus C3-41]
MNNALLLNKFLKIIFNEIENFHFNQFLGCAIQQISHLKNLNYLKMRALTK